MNYSFFKEIFQRNRTLFALAAVLFATIYPRIQTYFLPFTEELAKKEIYRELANESKDHAKDLYGVNITAEEEEKYAIKDYDRRLKDEKVEIKRRIEEKIREKRDYWQDENGQTYLLEFDPYYLYRYTRNLLSRGTIGDTFVDGKLYDTYSYAPQGKVIIPSFIIYVGFFFHKLFSFFNRNLPLANTLFFIPLLLSVLVSVAIFFFVKRFFGLLVAVISVFIITLTPIFLSRSMCGWFDNDCFNLLFPFLTVFIFYWAIQQNSFKRGITLISLASLSIGLYSLAWNGWWYSFYVVLAGTFVYTLNISEIYFRYKEKSVFIELKKMLIFLIIFIALSCVFVAIIAWPSRVAELFHAPMGVFKAVYAKQSFSTSIWPNTYLTVAELKGSDLRQIVYSVGDPLVFFIAILGLFLLIKPRFEKDKVWQYFGFVFTVWSLVIAFASLKAVRFSLLLSIPQGICFAVAVKFIVDLFFERVSLASRKKRLIIKSAFFVIAFFFIATIFQDRFLRVKNIMPMLNDDYAKVLERVKQESPKDTIINSWWDYGSWYAAVGERRVIFDGTTQLSPMAFWMARVLLTNDEAEAIGILRMINIGSNKAFEELQKSGLEDIDAIQLLRKIIVVDKKTAEVLLKGQLPEDVASKVLDYTHGSVPNAHFIVDGHMLDIIHALTLLGNWSPEKAFIWQSIHAGNASQALEIIQQKFNYTRNETVKLSKEALPLANKDLKNWASKIQQFYSPLSNGTKEDKMVLFDNNVAVSLNNFNARVKTAGVDSWKRPHSLIYPKGDGFQEVVYEDEQLPFTILLVPDENNSYKSIILDQDLAKSMLVRLFLLKGHGLKHFRFLFSEKKEGFGDINVWGVDWEGKQRNKITSD